MVLTARLYEGPEQLAGTVCGARPPAIFQPNFPTGPELCGLPQAGAHPYRCLRPPGGSGVMSAVICFHRLVFAPIMQNKFRINTPPRWQADPGARPGRSGTVVEAC